jgi:hypothetical protein
MQEDKIIAHDDLWQNARESNTWFAIVSSALSSLGGTATLRALYSAIERHPKTATRKHWKAKVRQVLQAHDAFVRVGDGAWSLASEHTAEEIEKLRSLRRERYPRRSAPAS